MSFPANVSLEFNSFLKYISLKFTVDACVLYNFVLDDVLLLISFFLMHSFFMPSVKFNYLLIAYLHITRKVSVMDVSKKYGLEYRLLHAITKGSPWYGEWGYEFGAGSFALTYDAYKMAIESLSSLPLSIFCSQGQEPCIRLQDMISHYQSFAKCKLVNIRDLFSFLMGLIHDAHKSSSGLDDISCKKSRACTSAVLWSFTGSDIERVEEAMFRVLRAVSGSNWVSCRALRGAVCKVGPPELLDYCLAKLGGKCAADGIVVKARSNPESGALEYR